MQKFQAQRRLREIAYSWPMLLLLLSIVFLLSRAVWGAYQKYAIAQTVLEKTRAENEQLKTRKTELEQKSAWLQTERGIEAQIRSSFQVAKPGEEVLIVVDEATTTEAVPEVPKPWWQFW